ncbi:Zinc finger BED domain-containing protein RICESLEEPER 1 [Rhynchospora pubera]|uniref:Zinc finger BED domain-containing protein RICESLEEPER 1 n=1 Tax=Rhynchospora pubera TaxID=906938 RepID=A0AAV8CPU1_9POAL|nr:Zinc finger BED domain-containing protein RICESLEEPER 1 [Rhynchospora pubera]
MSNIQLSGEHPGAAEGSRPKKKLKLRSEVWEHFEKTADGERAICKYCSKILSGNSKGGTTHLKRHIDICDKRPRGHVNQPVTIDSGDEVRNRNIGLIQKETWLEDVVKKAILNEVPFASEAFQKVWYLCCPMDSMDLEKEIHAYYEREKEHLAIELNNLTSRICFSVGIIHNGFLSLNAQFINADFNLVSKLISLKKLSDDYSPSSIINVLESFISEWKLEEKIFTFTIEKEDDINCWDELIKGLTEKFSPKMLFGGHHIGVPCCRGQLDQSYYSFRNSPFYSGEGDSIERFLEVLTTVPSKIDTFNHIAKDMGLSPINESWFHHHHFVVRYPIGSITNFARLLKDLLIYREVFSQYYAHTETDQLFSSGICSYSFHWTILELMLDISGLVNCAKNEFVSLKHPASHLYLRKIFEIVDMIAIKKKNSVCICADGDCRVHDWEYLRDQFARFVKEAEDIFIVAGVLDPRFKLSFFEYCVKEIGNFIGLEKTIGDYREIINKFFSEYAKKEADLVSPSLEVVGTINTQAHEGNLLNNNTYLPPTTITERFSLYKKEGKSELDKYLSEEVIDTGDEDFDLLGWWKQNQSRFPILSTMARDLLAVPASAYSTVSSNLYDLYDYEDKVTDKVDFRLAEAVICSKDWILAREQRYILQQNLMAYFYTCTAVLLICLIFFICM